MILTVGHSTHQFEEFVSLLEAAGVDAVVDVRRLPGSNRYPWFNEDALSASLPDSGISYQRIADLAGRRNRQHTVDDAVNGFWENRSFHNYADYALGANFASGLDELLALAAGEHAEHHVAIMCSEAVWWRCHRRIIADHLLARDVTVGHLMPDGRVTPAELTRGAVGTSGRVEYPAEQTG